MAENVRIRDLDVGKDVGRLVGEGNGAQFEGGEGMVEIGCAHYLVKGQVSELIRNTPQLEGSVGANRGRTCSPSTAAYSVARTSSKSFCFNPESFTIF